MIPARTLTNGLRVVRELPFRPPLQASNVFGHLAATAVPGVEEWRDGAYRSTLALPGGPAVVQVGLPTGDALSVVLRLADPADEPEAIRRIRLAFDLDLEPDAMRDVLRADPPLAPLVDGAPGRRVPGTLDPPAMLLRAVLGQQVSTAAARTHAARLVAAFGTPVEDPEGGLGRLFPSAAAMLADRARLMEALRTPATRRQTFVVAAEALADGRVDFSASPSVLRSALLALPGIGPWTADTVLMRALGDTDAFLPGDLGVVQAARRLNLPDRPRTLDAHSRRWSPYRAHAVQYLWATGGHAVNVLPGGVLPG